MKNKISQKIESLTSKIKIICIQYEFFPPNFRIVIGGGCKASCILNESNRKLCHNEGIPQLTNNINNIFPSSEVIKEVWNTNACRSIKLIGIDCVDIDSLTSFLEGISFLNWRDISTTISNLQFVEEFINQSISIKLNRFTLSVHRFNGITRKYLDNIVNLIGDRRKVKINRVLLNSTVNDLPEMIDWVNQNRITLRLFSLINNRLNEAEYLKEYIHWVNLFPIFEKQIHNVEIIEYILSNRRKYKFHLKSEAIIEANISLINDQSRIILQNDCRLCSIKNQCEEGYFGCGIRLGPDNRIYPCLLRPELSFALPTQGGKIK